MKQILILICCSWLSTANAQITLNGHLLTDAEKPVPDTKIGVAAGPSNFTDSKGQFSIKLSLDFIEGERVFLVVEKKDWVINYPLDGEWNLPAKKLQEVPEQYTKIIIVPFGSKALWSHARIEKHIALLSDEIAKLKKEGDTPRPVDFSYYLSEWADKYGFTPTEVKTAFDQWSDEAANSEDYRTLGLRAFYEKNFAEAAENFEKAALQNREKRKFHEEGVRIETRNEYTNWKDAGNSLSNEYRFEEALAKYDSASSLVTRADYPNEWAEIRIYIGINKREIGIRTDSEKANLFLKESEQAYREAFEVYTREQLPQDWAGTQNNLGNVYRDLGTRTGGEEGAKLLQASVRAYENALVVYTREQLPQQWATTQNNLGGVYWSLGTRTGGEEGAKFLRASVRAYENALVVRTREQLPQDWAGTQNNLGTVLSALGTRTGGEEGVKLLHAAVMALKASLEIRSSEYLPVDWAQSQNNLAETYTHLEDWPNVAECYVNVLKVYPGYEKAYQAAVYLYHEALFDFSEAFVLNQNWLAQFPDDLSAQCDFAEKHFTTGRFAECGQRLSALLLDLKVESRIKIALSAIGIANALAQNKTQQVPVELETLQYNIAAQPDTFQVGWTFNGTKHFISIEPKLELHREWLLQFFAAIESKEGREAILAGLREVRERFGATK